MRFSAVINHFTFKSKYYVEIKDAVIKKRSPKKLLNIKKGGKPILLKELVATNCGALINMGFWNAVNMKVWTTFLLVNHGRNVSFVAWGLLEDLQQLGKQKYLRSVKREVELLYINDMQRRI